MPKSKSHHTDKLERQVEYLKQASKWMTCLGVSDEARIEERPFVRRGEASTKENIRASICFLEYGLGIVSDLSGEYIVVRRVGLCLLNPNRENWSEVSRGKDLGREFCVLAHALIDAKYEKFSGQKPPNRNREGFVTWSDLRDLLGNQPDKRRRPPDGKPVPRSKRKPQTKAH